MPEYAPLDIPSDGQLVDNLVHFARALRKAGLPVGTGRVMDAIEAVEMAGFTDKRDFFYILQACFVSRAEHRTVFAQIFRLFWRDPKFLEHMMAMMLPAIRGVQDERTAEAAEKRAAEALLDGAAPPEKPEENNESASEIEIDASLTMSREERLRQLDFEQMSLAEMAEAKRILANLDLPFPPLPARRFARAPYGRRPDWRASMRSGLRHGGEILSLARQRPQQSWPDLVALCDISGSMSAYSRAILHFLHGLSQKQGAKQTSGWGRIHAFTFGTRLTNITRHLALRDVDAALGAAGAQAQDWEGGTRIGQCLRDFNKDWGRRVLGRSAVLLLITDGLERDDPDLLGTEIERLHLSTRRLIWLNPLLRWEQFAPRAAGVRAMLPHVDSFRAGHNIASLQGLAAALSAPEDDGEKSRLMRMVA